MRKALTQLLELSGQLELFNSVEGEAFAAIPVNGHIENWPICSAHFQAWLGREYYHATKDGASPQELRACQNTLSARARYEGEVQAVFVRVAEDDGHIFLDLGNENWQTVEVSRNGWRILDHAPVRFQRTQGTRALPMPMPGGAVEELREFVNVATDADFQLLVAFLLSTLRAHGPFPGLCLVGEYGTAKTTVARAVGALVDPREASVRAEARNIRDLMLMAKSCWLLAFDNLSSLPEWLSDALCRLSTGGGFATRKLFTDTDQVLIDAQRPTLLTAIGNVITRGDLLDRAIVLELPTIDSSKRRTEADFWNRFEAARPRILGALLDAVAGALRQLPTIELPHYPRMADFIVWTTAAEKQLGWPGGSVLAAHEENKSHSDESALDASPITPPLLTLLQRGPWSGQASSLLQALTEHAEPSALRQHSWPKTPKMLAEMLRRVAPNLRNAGIAVDFWRAGDRRRTRMIRLASLLGTDMGKGEEDFADHVGIRQPGPVLVRTGGTPKASGEVLQASNEAANALLEEALSETRALLEDAKSEGDMRARAAAIRELRALAERRFRNPSPRSSEAKEFFRSMTDQELINYVREHSAAFGFHEPDANDSPRPSGTGTPEGAE